MPENHSHNGPLHLQRYLSLCTDAMADVIRSSVGHPVTVVSSLHCLCTPTTVVITTRRKSQVVSPPRLAPVGEADARTAESRRRSVEGGDIPAGGVPLADARGSDAPSQERRQACRFFALQMNDEEGMVHACCRRCSRIVLVYDRALYWGVKRQTGVVPPTYPYKCSCGGHAFEVAVGLDYPDEALDENDLNMITVAVRCASCNEIAVIFDDEAT